MPWRYVEFLDYAARHRLLLRVGSGYRFSHTQLQDYFAARYTETRDAANQDASR
jgi:hypothetical protein